MQKVKLQKRSPEYILFKNRLKSLQKTLLKQVYWIENSIDLFYLTGLKLSSGTLVVSSKKALLFIDGRYLQVAKEKEFISSELVDEDNFIDHLFRDKVEEVFFDSSKTSYERFLYLKRLARKFKNRHNSSLAFSPKPRLLKDLRSIKTEEELASLRKSGELLWKGFEYLKKTIKPGISEEEASLLFEIFCKKRGAEDTAFKPIIAFGENSAKPHHISSKKILEKEEIALIDIGIMLNGYCSDMTRMLFVKSADRRLKLFYQVVRKAHKKVLSLCRPGVFLEDLDREARLIMRENGVESYFLHSLGHGIGLEVHEFPTIRCNGQDKKIALQPGMVITIEPGLYLPGVGGIRYEDTLFITKQGYENLYTETT